MKEAAAIPHTRKDFLSVLDFESGDLERCLAFAAQIKADRSLGRQAPTATALDGRHVAMLFEKAVGNKVTMVQYRGSAPAYADIIAGRVDLMCDSTGGSVAQVKGGGVNAFVVTGNKRISSLPEVPFSSEAELKDLGAMVVWYALFAPAGTPKPIVDKVVAALRTAGHDPEVIAKMSSWDATIYETNDVTPAALRETMSSNVAMWTQLIQGAGLTPQ